MTFVPIPITVLSLFLTLLSSKGVSIVWTGNFAFLSYQYLAACYFQSVCGLVSIVKVAAVFYCFFKMAYTNEEAFDMLMVLGECLQNYTAAANMYAERYPDREHFSRMSFQRLANRVRETGRVHPDKNKGKELARPVRRDRAPEVLAAVQLNPQDSTRRIALDSGISQRSVLRILKDNQMYPYMISLHQELHGDDNLQRMNFCLWARQQLQQNHHFFRNVLWCDEATFRSNGEVNRHNMRYWAIENPHWMREIDNQRYWALNTWCGILGSRVVGPFFFEGNLDGDTYNHFLVDHLPNLLIGFPEETIQNMWFMHDGAPAHYAQNVRQTLDEQYPGRWIGRGGPIHYPPRSPDLTCMDFYLWGRLKDLVHTVRPTTREDMMQRIRDAVNSISNEEILRAVDSFNTRVDLCIENNGLQFEHL